MFIQRMRHSRLLRIAVIFSLLISMLLPFLGRTVHADRESIVIANNSYIALDSVSLTPGADNQTLRFGVELVNGSDAAIDFNKFGVRIVDGNGSSYSVDLSERMVARVQPGESTIFRYISQIPNGISADALKVALFAWDMNKSTFMTDIGTLAVGTAVQPTSSKRQSMIMNLNDIDSNTYPTDSLISFELIRSYKALVNGTWMLYTDIVAENLSGTSYKLPGALSFFLRDSSQLTYAATAYFGGDQTILPHQRQQITIQSSVGSAGDNGGFILEFDKKISTSTGSTSQNNLVTSISYTSLGKLDLSRSLQLNTVGESASQASKEASSLTFTVDKATSALKSDGVHVDASFTVKNDTNVTMNVPNFNASLQLSQSTLSVTVADTVSTHPTYLSKGESTNYRFAGVLPKGVDPSAVQLVVFDKKQASPAISIPVNVTQLPAAVDGSGAGLPGGVLTSAGNLSLTLKSTYRLMTESGDDVLMSEITVQNVDSKMATLPATAAFYGGHMLGDFDAMGKAIRLQSSPYLVPGQKTTVYVYTKIPYNTSVDSGYVYIGDGTFNNSSQIWTTKNEWIEIPFTTVNTTASQISLNSDWFIGDTGRQATGKIKESKVYDSGTQKMVVIRIAQTNKETRNGVNVPYIGYLTDTKGGIWALKSTEDTTSKLCKECQALTTLWAIVPASTVTDGGLQFVFGQKIDDVAFATAQQYAFSVSGETGSIIDSQIQAASLYPYNVSVQNVRWRYIEPTGSTPKQSGTLSPIPANSTVEVAFDFNLTKTAELTGIAKNRILQFALTDSSGNIMGKTFDYSMDGQLLASGGSTTTPLIPGNNGNSGNTDNSVNTVKLQFTGLTIDQLTALFAWPHFALYEKFEGGTRLIGNIIPTYN